MIIDCISDLHGARPVLQGGDLLIIAGDLTAKDTPEEHKVMLNWMGMQDYDEVFFIAGNHDGHYVNQGQFVFYGDKSFVYYIFDSYMEFWSHKEKRGVKVYGSPWTPTFCNWHFMKDRGEPIRMMWDNIPNDTDILVTHGPPHGILDRNSEGKSVGCHDLKKAISRIKPKYSIFGHIHEGYGEYEDETTKYINCAHCDEYYIPHRKPVRIEI